MICLSFAPYNLENEELPIKVSGLTNTVLHLGWCKCHLSRRRTVFAFEDCENVVVRDIYLLYHSPKAREEPLYTVKNCPGLKVYGFNEIDVPAIGKNVR